MKIERPKIVEENLELGEDLVGWMEECQQLGQDLKGKVFANQVVTNLTVENLDITKCIFRRCRFVGCTLEKVGFSDVVFEKCDQIGRASCRERV